MFLCSIIQLSRRGILEAIGLLDPGRLVLVRLPRGFRGSLVSLLDEIELLLVSLSEDLALQEN